MTTAARRLLPRLLLLATGVAVASWVVWHALAIYSDHIEPKTLVVENKTGYAIGLQVGTSYHLELGPHSTDAIHTGWFPASGLVELASDNALRSAVLCDFDLAVKEPLVIDDTGTYCGVREPVH